MKKIFTIICMFSLLGLNNIFSQTVTDFDGNIYNTVTIGTQVWIKENLKTTKYRDGTAIPNVINSAAWEVLTTGAFSYYNNSIDSGNIYGALYNWYVVNNIVGLCPANWHVPSDAEWNILEKFLDNTVDTTVTSYVGTDIGGKLKEIGNSHWTSPNTGATNNSGFGALPGGTRYSDGTYYNIEYNGHWWSATAYDATNSWVRNLYYDNSKIFRGYGSKKYGFSVRCVRDLAADIKDINYNEQIKIYPNPANDKIVIEGLQNSIIEIINIKGQVVKIVNVSTTKTTIDLTKLMDGVYTMKIKSDNGIIVKKLIKE